MHCADENRVHAIAIFLSISSSILKYVVRKYQLPERWYPSDVQRQAKVDEYLGWHSTNLRRGAAGLIFTKVCNSSNGSTLLCAFIILTTWEDHYNQPFSHRCIVPHE